MTRNQMKAKVLEVLGEIAPEVDLQAIEPDTDFREQMDIDSMDYLNFVIKLDEEFKANIPERAYTRFVSLNACVDQLESILSQRPRG
ncbi:MAG: acyl carrier protein [Chloracidobacterium sp.]|nr:acyl carrier protein [Chloracidobacterium sp.]